MSAEKNKLDDGYDVGNGLHVDQHPTLEHSHRDTITHKSANHFTKKRDGIQNPYSSEIVTVTPSHRERETENMDRHQAS